MEDATNPKPKTRDVDATPYAASLIEGHRDFGYSLETALADIIDNAITAGARTVELIADKQEQKDRDGCDAVAKHCACACRSDERSEEAADHRRPRFQSSRRA